MNRRRARLPVAFVVLGMLATCVWASAAETLSPLALRLGFGGTVTYVGPPSREELVPQPGLTCKAGLVIVSPRTDPAGTPYCIAASTAGLQVMFAAKLPFPTPKSIDCTELRGADRGATSDVLAVEARIARAVNGAFVYDGGRAACNLNPAFAYALTVETRTNGSSGGTPMIPAERADTRTLTIPWSLLHLDRQAAGILIQVNLCGHQAGCSTEIRAVRAAADGRRGQLVARGGEARIRASGDAGPGSGGDAGARAGHRRRRRCQSRRPRSARGVVRSGSELRQRARARSRRPSARRR